MTFPNTPVAPGWSHVAKAQPGPPHNPPRGPFLRQLDVDVDTDAHGDFGKPHVEESLAEPL